MSIRTLSPTPLCLAILLTAPPLAAAQTPAAIHACVQQGSDRVRIVSATEHCRGPETRVTWNVAGPVGPTGSEGPRGPKGDIGATGPQGPAGNSMHAYAPAAISYTTLEACVQNPGPEGRVCHERARVAVMLPEHGFYEFDIVNLNENGHEVRRRHITMVRPPQPGSPCASNAVDIGVATTTDTVSGTFRFCLTPDAPIYNLKSDPEVPENTKTLVNLIASYIPDGMIVFEVDPGILSDTLNVSGGHIAEGFVGYSDFLPYLSATIVNINEMTASYVVTLSDIVPAECRLEPVEPVTRVLGPYAEVTFRTDLRPREGTVLPPTCKARLSLLAADAQVLDGVDVIWHNPVSQVP